MEDLVYQIKDYTSIVLSYCEFVFHVISLLILSIILCCLGKYLIDHDFPGPSKDHLLLAPCPVEPHLTDQIYHFFLEKNILTLTLHLTS